jgi:hypothetical protein
MADFTEVIKSHVAEIRRLSTDDQGSTAWFEAANLALSVLHDTVGGGHPLMVAIRDALNKADYARAVAAARAVITLCNSGGLTSPRLAISSRFSELKQRPTVKSRWCTSASPLSLPARRWRTDCAACAMRMILPMTRSVRHSPSCRLSCTNQLLASPSSPPPITSKSQRGATSEIRRTTASYQSLLILK